MVMSMASDDSRCYCIRCGGLEFRVVSDVLSTPRRVLNAQRHASNAGSDSVPLLTAMSAATAEAAGEVCQR
jgi:hypothetical protein